jgi:ATP-dependent Lon protease
MTASKTPANHCSRRKPDSYPVLPLRDIVVFPHMIVPLFVGREKSIRALEEVMKNDAHILLATQKNASDDDPAPDSIYEIGTLASVLQLLKLPDGTVKVLVEGVERAKVEKYSDRRILRGRPPSALADADDGRASRRSAVAFGRLRVRELCEAQQEDLARSRRRRAGRSTTFAKLADTVASHLAVKIADRQAVLETLSVAARWRRCSA